MEGNNHALLIAHTPGNHYAEPRRAIGCAVALDEGGDFAMGCTLSPDVGAQPVYHSTPEALLSSFITARYRTHELLLHGADHDMRYFLPFLEQLTTEGYETLFIVNGQGKIMHVRISHHRHSWYIRDTFGLMPQPLRELTKLANYTGDYQELPPDPYDLDGPAIEPMLYRDCRIILRAYRALTDTMRDTFGVRPAWTIGATAMRAYLTTLPPGHVHYRQRPAVDALARDGYFGALNFLTSYQEHEDVTYIDVNAMYAHAMRQGVPVMGAIQTREEIAGFPGMYQCTVTPPDSLFIPIVPYRDPQSQVVSYPRHGVFSTVVCTHTMQLARELGYKIDVEYGYFWEQTEAIFDTFVDRCEELEARFRESGNARIIKDLRNTLYGKFGQRPRGKEYLLALDPPDEWTPEINGFDGMPIGNLYFRYVTIERPYMMPHWAAWITATARNTLARAAMALDPRSLYYGDNDSLMLDTQALEQAVARGAITMGSKYGEWKVAKHYISLQPYGKKRYRGIRDTGEIDEYDIKWVGIPRGTITAAVLSQVQPGGPPVESPPYKLHNRAMATTGGREKWREVTQTIVIPADFYIEKIPAYEVLHE